MTPRIYTDEQKKQASDRAKARWADPAKKAAIMAKMKAVGATRRAETKLRKAQEKAEADAKAAELERLVAGKIPEPKSQPERFASIKDQADAGEGAQSEGEENTSTDPAEIQPQS